MRDFRLRLLTCKEKNGEVVSSVDRIALAGKSESNRLVAVDVPGDQILMSLYFVGPVI